MSTDDVRHGIYRHYKGQHYLVLGVAKDANDNGRVVVVYVGLEFTNASDGPRMNVRTIDDFLSSVCGNESCPNRGKTPGAICQQPYHGHWPRFTYLGPEYQAGMTREGQQ